MTQPIGKKRIHELDSFVGELADAIVLLSKDNKEYKLDAERLLFGKPLVNIKPIPVLGNGPICTLTKATGISGATIVSGGTGYTVGDNLVPVGGTFAVAGKVKVLEVDEQGSVTRAAVQLPGVYSKKPDGDEIPTTEGTGSGAKLKLSWNAGVASSIYNGKTTSRTDDAFDYTGYDLKDVSSGYRGNGVQNGTQCIVEFISDASALDFRLSGGNGQYDLYVDGQRVSDQPVQTDTSGSPHIYTVDWQGKSALRHYRLCAINMGFGGVITAQKFTLMAPLGRRRPLAWQMGDSYTVGIGATQASYNDFRVMCDALGIDGIADGISGAGWTSIQEGRVPAERVRLKLGSINRQPQYVFLSLGYNDAASGRIEVVKNNFTESVTEIRKLCPQAKIIVIGPATPLGHTAQLDAIRDALMECCETLSLPFIDIRDVVNSSNKGLYTGSDAVHPSNEGHVFRGLILALRASSLL